MPRDPVVQGVLAGSVAVIGYGIGHLLRWMWLLLDIPQPFHAWYTRLQSAACGLALLIVAAALWKFADWQNATRTVMDLPPVPTRIVVKPFMRTRSAPKATCIVL